MLLYSSCYKNKKVTRGAAWWRRTAHELFHLPLCIRIGHWRHTSFTLTYQIKVIVVAAAAWPLANGCVPSTAAAVAVGLGCHAR
jgi:hypothetical protein